MEGKAGKTELPVDLWGQGELEVGVRFVIAKMSKGSMRTDIKANHPTAVVFEKSSQKTYAVYNYDTTEKTVTFSDGTVVLAAPNGFTLQ